MGLNALDIIVLLVVGGAGLLGAAKGFVSEVLSLFAWVAIVFVVKLFHTPVAKALTQVVGTVSGAATLAFVVLAGGTYIVGRLIANQLGRRTRSSILGPVDRALGLGFGLVKGLILSSLAFLLVVMATDTVTGTAHRPRWIVAARTYPLLNTTSAAIADFADRRRRGVPVFGPRPTATPAATAQDI